MKGKRDLLARVLLAAGADRLLWKVLPPGLYCFNYHRIGNAQCSPFDRGVFSCTEDTFRRHVRLISRRFRVVTPTDLLIRADWPADARLAMITFDDGYIDNYSLALPALKQEGVRATFFITSGFVGSGAVPWWDEIAWLVRNAAGPTLHLVGEVVDLPQDGRELAIHQTLRLKKRRSDVSTSEFMSRLREASQAPRLPDIDRLFMDWSEVKQLSESGMEVGSHTVRHEVLSHLSDAQQRDEIVASKSRLEAATRMDVVAFAYPVGGLTSFNESTVAALKESGYKIAFTFIRGVNALPLRDPFRVRRFAVDGDMTSARLRLMAGMPQLFS